MTAPALDQVVRPPPRAIMREEVLAGLRKPRKSIPCKYFYDAEGARLFERICALPEYYLTRSELQIMQQYGREIARCLGPRCLLIEYGSGSSRKTRLLLEMLEAPAAYVPIDICREHLGSAAAELRAQFSQVEVLPVCGDYTRRIGLPTPKSAPAKTVVYFPGSTIGNFDPPQAVRFLRNIARLCGRGGGALIGVDVKKDPAMLHAAYNDAEGVTAAFNLNLLARLNRELDANFDLAQFRHYAFYNPRRGRIEMHLVSQRKQVIRIAGAEMHFAAGESIHTESSYKYTPEEFTALAAEAGLTSHRLWLDTGGLFSVHYLEAK